MFRSAFFVLLLSSAVGFSQLYVSPTGTGLDCTASNPCSFKTAFNKVGTVSDPVVEIVVEPGTYELTSTLTTTVPNGKNLIIRRDYSSPGYVVLKPADLNNRIKLMKIIAKGNANVTIEGLAFIFGLSKNGLGGALFVKSETGSVVIDGCKFKSNSAYKDGGALSLQSQEGNLTVANSKFYNNVSYGSGDPVGCCGGGGALDIRSNYGNVTIENSIFKMNHSAHNGGAIEAHSSTGIVRIESNIFEGNSSGAGGAVNAGSINGTVVMVNNMLHNNQSYGMGGGAFLVNTPGWSGCLQGGNNCPPSPVHMYVVNNTFHSNISENIWGGALGVAIWNDNSGLYVYNNIFWQNINRDTDNYRGDDLFVHTGTNPSYAPTIELYNNIFDLNASFTPSGGAVVSEDLYIWNATNYSYGGNIKADPRFVNGGEGDLHITRRSPAVDSGNNFAPMLPSDDFEGDPRDTRIDIGADEIQRGSRRSR